ncbi:putative nuclease HARBI1 [Blattella germanica]|nr:putative nuclease HARBI1 [Blattella germanica]
MGDQYRNRKGFFSLNVQVVSDAMLKITNIVARWPGSVHDATIFNNSKLRAQFESGAYVDSLLLGDSGYGIKSYLMTPLLAPNTPAEALYNASQIRTRNVVERLFGVWKRRFPILSIGIRIKLTTAQLIIVACAVLHNIARDMKDPEPDIVQENNVNNDFGEEGPMEGQNYVNREGDVVRQMLIQNYFSNLQ